MTSPVAQGFPDYQRNRPAQNVIYETFTSALNGVVTRGPFFTSYFTATRFKITANTQHTTLTATWFSDEAGSAILGSSSFTTQANTGADISFPNQGPWVKYTLTPHLTPDTITVIASAITYIGVPSVLENANIIIGTENAALGIGATLSIFANYIAPGNAILNVNMNQKPYTVSLAGTDITGARVPFFQWTEAAQSGLLVPVILPASIVRILVNNASGVAATVSAYLVADPWPIPATG